MNQIHRRQFIRAAGAASALALGAPHLAGARGRDRKYRTAIIGGGWWGNVIGEMAMASGAVEIASVCDVDRRMIDDSVKLVREKSGVTPKAYGDYRELLVKEKPEICIVATPDHWHPLIAIAAAESGAHVYVEKPVGHTILEGRAMVKAARAAGCVMQVGLHRRVTPHGLSAFRFVKEGRLGKIGMVRAFVAGAAGAGQPEAPALNGEPPPELDWDMWCGPGPLKPYNPAYHPKRFRQFLDFANGQIGDWVHWTDQIQWILGDDRYPTSASAAGGIFIRQPTPETAPPNTTVPDAPDTLAVHWDFGDCIAAWEHRQYAGNNQEKARIGCYFFGAHGVLHVGWGEGWTFYPSRKGEKEIHVEPTLHPPGQQNVSELWADFIDAIETKRLPAADIELGHRSTTLSLLGILSYKLGRSVKWDGTKEECPGDPEANKLLRRDYRAPWVYPQV